MNILLKFFLNVKYLYKNIIMRDIKSIINEEIIRLNETISYTSDNFLFNQVLRDQANDFFNYDTSDQYDFDIIESVVIISWRITFWLGEISVENFRIEKEKIDGHYVLEQYDKVSQEHVNNTTKSLSEIDWDVDFSDAVLTINKGLEISGLEFDFKTNKCKAKF